MTSSLPKGPLESLEVEPRSPERRPDQDVVNRRKFTAFEVVASIRTQAEASDGANAVELAGRAFEMLNGARFVASAFDYPGGVRAERIREALPGVTAQFARVIADGTNNAYSTLDDFASALDEAAVGSAGDLAAAADQAISARDMRAAALFLELGRGYAPDFPELAAVALRFAPAAAQSQQPYAGDEEAFDLASEQARFLATLKASIPEVKTERARLPWLAIAAGLFGMFAVITVIGVVIVQAW
jgi:hypothetical protein